MIVFQLEKGSLPRRPDPKLAEPLLFRLSTQFHPWGGNRAWNDLEQKDNF